MRGSGQLPDLSGVRVFVVGLGDTAAPQVSLDTASRTALVDQWTALLSAFVLVPVYTDRGNGIVPIGLLALGLLLFTAFAPRLGEMRARS